eukprot:CAMPEP_0182930108 /NCGR_PEP_ID=MMETSP0105_2-20130417/23929_1 /TAXON_ID=81532 ORGANISM="Acanthoeca-like sp., Strain 10tr" /NCGR_SAMPLE_ID=MMETSP0105_2 /ASSEMBLY_ACC=CAM_ASM_000205 /LENGTH=121 /DNA_ID=CAMNT_0025068337 /DNA_START=141 /DNA_END=503 /DNA_ORIENTATION=-
MGVKNDPSRVSTVVAHKPFMGLLPENQTKSWSEDVYSKAWSNTCWELYGIGSPDNYPGTNQRTTISISNPTPGAIKWGNWSTRQATCPGAPVASITNRQTTTEQTIVWDGTALQTFSRAVA